MTKSDFLKKLRKGLRGMSAAEKNEQISFYSEIIDDKIEEGMTEHEATSHVGRPLEISRKIKEERSTAKPTGKGDVKTLTGTEKLVMIIGSPIWIPLAIAAAAIIASCYIIIYALLLCLWAVEAPFLILSLISKVLLPTSIGATKGVKALTSASLKRLASIIKG